MGQYRTSQEGWGSVYNGPVIDAHTHPMLSIDDQVGAEEHPPEAYRKLVSGSPITRAAALTIAPAARRHPGRRAAWVRRAGTAGHPAR